MNAKAYFAQARSLPMQIQAKTKQLQAIRTLQEPLAALPEASKLLSDLAADITAEVQAYAALQRQLQTLIDSLPVPEYRTLLELRYLSGSKWEEIAEAMSMHVRWVYRMHGRALQAAQNLRYGEISQ